jgi:Spy/CpxP family protein refolding chaperone
MALNPWTRRTFWLGGGAMAAAAAVATLSPRAWAFGRGPHAFGGFGGHHGHGGFSQRLLADPEAAKQRMAFAAEWVLRTVDGTDEQRQQARRITDRLVDELRPLAERHREQHAAVVRELSKPSIDREEIERLRQDGIKLADEASKSVVVALSDFSEVLKPEQRAELVEWMSRFHER